MELGKYIACICEGSAEQAIIDILLDHELLIFRRENLIDEKVLRCRSAERFEQDYLRFGYTEPISVIRILDSRREKFKLSKAYISKVKVINIITAPEIEMLIILHEGQYKQYKKSGKKPSEFCRAELKMRNVKQYDFVRDYFEDPSVLKAAIDEYSRISNVKKGEYTLQNILRRE